MSWHEDAMHWLEQNITKALEENNTRKVHANHLLKKFTEYLKVKTALKFLARGNRQIEIVIRQLEDILYLLAQEIHLSNSIIHATE